GLPDGGGGVDHVEVVAHHLQVGDLVSGVGGCSRVPPAEVHQVEGVAGALDDELPYLERHPPQRGGPAVDAFGGGVVPGGGAERGGHGARAEPPAVALDQVEHARQRHGQRDAGAVGGGPQGELAAGRVPGDRHPLRVERRLQAGERGQPGGHVGDGGVPAVQVGAAVLQVPDGEPAGGQVGAERLHEVGRPDGPPVSAVQEHHD